MILMSSTTGVYYAYTSFKERKKQNKETARVVHGASRNRNHENDISN